MIPELGHFLLILSALLALVVPIGVFIGYRRDSEYLIGLWKPGLTAVFIGLTLSVGALIYAFLADDFSVTYVVNHSNTKLDAMYKVAAVWGSHEGSMLLWIWVIAAWAAATALLANSEKSLDGRTQAVVLAVIGLLCVFLFTTSNPFDRTLPIIAPEGKDLNPVLQDIGMILHPPMLFFGYAGVTFCFALSIALLLIGRLRKQYLDKLESGIIVAWLFLTAGNMLGSWWAYNELGWGGWWFWDPVENASFIPWLLLTAELHALLLVKLRNHLKKTTLMIALAAFALCLLGTFIVRSGIIQSVHAFASDPNRGIALAVVSLLILIPGFIVFAIRSSAMDDEKAPEVEVRDLGLFLAVMLLSAASVCVLFGTLFPLVYSGFGLGSISVGAPYFNSIFAPMACLAALLIGLTQLKGALRFVQALCLIVSLATAGTLVMLTEPKDAVMCAAGIFSVAWILSTAAASLFVRNGHRNWFALLAHLGIAVSIVGVVGDTQYQQEALVRMGPGQGRPLGDVIFVYDKTNKINNKSYFADEAEILVLDKDENELMTLRPQRQTFKSNGMEMTAAGISHGFTRDLYVSMGNQLSAEEYLVRLNIKPFVSWIWYGGLIMILAGFMALMRRKFSSKESK